MMCESCDIAFTQPETVFFSIGCRECDARALSQSDDYLETQRTGALTDRYRDALIRIWGEDWHDGHASARAWAIRVAEARRNKQDSDTDTKCARKS